MVCACKFSFIFQDERVISPLILCLCLSLWLSIATATVFASVGTPADFERRKSIHLGSWVSWSVKCPSVGFCSGRHLRAVRSSPKQPPHRAWKLPKILFFPLSPTHLFLPLLKKKKYQSFTFSLLVLFASTFINNAFLS